MEYITTEQLSMLFAKIAARFAENETLLCEMDSKMGDGDLGLIMKKGFEALPHILEEMDETGLSKKLRRAGMEMSDVIPSTMGMLMGTGISFGGKALAGYEVIDAEGLSIFLEGFCDGIQKRGKCICGDRTVLDSIAAAKAAAQEVLQRKKQATLGEVATAAVNGAQRGVEATKRMKPKFGKAAVHANAAEGVADQGAMAGLIMIEGIRDFVFSA